MAGRLTARDYISRLHEKGWSTQKIAQAVVRNRGQIVQTAQGTKPSANLIPALQALAERKTVPKGAERPKPAPHVPPRASIGKPAVGSVRQPREGVEVRQLPRGRRIVEATGGASILPELRAARDRKVMLTITLDTGQKVTLYSRGGWSARKLSDAMEDGEFEFLEAEMGDVYGGTEGGIASVQMSYM